MSEIEKKNIVLNQRTSRRTFIKNTGLTVGGIVLGGAVGSLVSKESKVQQQQVVSGVSHEAHDYSEALQFFTRKEDFDALAAATEQIYPEDEHGPGAINLGVPYYIDKQLASPWGRNADDYMERPFRNGETPLNRGDIMILGVRKLNEVANTNHQKAFNTITEDEQIAILKEFESGNIELQFVSSAAFFGLLRQLTIEGCYCDPMHGGNKNMAGWKMREFPGAYMSYVDVIESKEFVYKEPKSLSDHLH